MLLIRLIVLGARPPPPPRARARAHSTSPSGTPKPEPPRGESPSLSLAPLIEARPWQSESGGKLRRFVQGQWNLVGEAEARKMHRCEAQAWLAVYNLLVDGSVRSKYALTSFRRNQLLRLRGFLNEATVDQVTGL